MRKIARNAKGVRIEVRRMRKGVRRVEKRSLDKGMIKWQQ